MSKSYGELNQELTKSEQLRLDQYVKLEKLETELKTERAANEDLVKRMREREHELKAQVQEQRFLITEVERRKEQTSEELTKLINAYQELSIKHDNAILKLAELQRGDCPHIDPQRETVQLNNPLHNGLLGLKIMVHHGAHGDKNFTRWSGTVVDKIYERYDDNTGATVFLVQDNTGVIRQVYPSQVHQIII